eukprot:4423524-Prymnesium_polylepis.2
MQFVVILFGVVVLHDPLTLASAAGILLAMGGGIWYGQARARLTDDGGAPPARRGGEKEKEHEAEALVPQQKGDVESGASNGGAEGRGTELRPLRR